MRGTKVKVAVGLTSIVSLCAVLGSVAPAAAATDPPSGVNVWSGDFTGTLVNYPDPGSDCVTLPFEGKSIYNNTDKTFAVYRTADCSSWAISSPPNDIHSFVHDPIRSFRLVG